MKKWIKQQYLYEDKGQKLKDTGIDNSNTWKQKQKQSVIFTKKE